MSTPGMAAPRGLLCMLLALSLMTTSACDDGPTSTGEHTRPLLDGPFVAVSHELSPESWERLRLGLGVTPETRGVEGNGTFYLALRKKELGQRWFMSAFLKQDTPADVFGGFVNTLGVRVVSFQVQNGKLYVFDVDDTKVRSELFKPDEVIEAWPIITDDAAFNRLPGSEDYILFDPAAGLDRFMGLDAGLTYGDGFEVEMAFARRFRKLDTGIAFEKLITGHALPYFADFDFPTRVTATLAVELKRYQEGAGFTTPPAPPLTHYFLNDPRIIPNSGLLTQEVPIKWNIRPGMKPITWVISDTLVKAQQDPRYRNYDIIGAVKRGVEQWNEAFGFQALSARVAQPNESLGDLDLNSIFFDPDPSYTTAFADFRANPNTGEILGANVYLPIRWLDAAVAAGEAEPMTAGTAVASRSKLGLSWNGMAPERLCELDVSEALAGPAETVSMFNGTLPPLTTKERVERTFTDVVMHEIGHTLGLRHNFKGSLTFPSSSVMEYTYLPEQAYRGGSVGPYDMSAIRYLYGLSSSLPEETFCTDDDLFLDVDCNRRDTTANPLELFYGPAYREQLRANLETGAPAPDDDDLNSVLQYVRSGRSSQEKLRAWNIATEGLLAPIPPETLAAFPGYGARADTQSRRILRRLYLDDVITRGYFFSADPRPNSLFTPVLLAQLRGNLLNVDGVRTRATRRTAIDILKKLQTYEAFTVLREARDIIGASLPGLSGQERLDAEDLVSRLNQATSPYFN
ncbi:zinc-dependent metalloprotease [Pyxidicoccus parkwayensis]|uniref:Zinc-dependent metalloprotease n=1 Tax=Pyxidicoccus parkwayensis TaxID=2813578 RepID=A0ABX7P5L6_9BACT|nr:zinc-dependent metalloprotease [Pyxidicoccus parkwaysis]QSQ25775.1 zinc-dependent metalloprotease [Pyxidicoccus parkwaysis]